MSLTKEMLDQFRRQAFTISKDKQGFSVSDSIANSLTEIGKYQVPRGTHLFLPGEKKNFNFFIEFYGAETTPAKITTGTFLIRKEDPLGTQIHEVESGIIERFGGSVHDEAQRPQYKSDQLLLQNTVLRILCKTAAICSGTNSNFYLDAIALIPKDILR